MANANGSTKVKSVQVTNVDPQPISSHIFPITFYGGNDIAPGWDANDRDWWLRNFWKKFGNDLLQAFLAASVAKVVTQNWTLEGPENKVRLYHRLLRDGFDFGKGYDHGIARGVIDYYTQDNGWFIERQRASMADHTGPCLGLSHLDSQRMHPSGNDEFPYYYEDVYGQYHLMHRSQYIRIVDMPDSATELYSEERGFCALSRALSTAMILSLLVTMKREKLSDLPPSAIAVFNNINRKQFENALTLQGLNEDNSGSVVWRSVMPLFGIDPAHPATLNFISFREVWEGFDERSAWDIAAYSFAAAWRMDVREVWPASQGPLGTGKEAEVQHQKAKSKSTGLLFTNLERAWNHDWTLPEDVRFKFMIQDIDEEEQRTAVHSAQIANIKTIQDAGAALTAEEVRYLLIQSKILPRGFEKAPEEGASINIGNVPVYIDDVERASKEFWGPTVIVDADGTKTYIEQGFTRGMKGSAGSGDWGHRGRPGKRGGSSKGSTLQLVAGSERRASKLGLKPKKDVDAVKRPITNVNVDIDEDYFEDTDELEESIGMSVEDIQHMFHVPEHIMPGSSTEVILSREGSEITASVVINDRYGSEVAVMERSFDSDRTAYNYSFEVFDGGKGLGSAMYVNQISVLRKAGYKSLGLNADLTIGRYAWAKQGFKYSASGKASAVTDRFPTWAKSKGISEPSSGWPKFKTPRDVANFKIPGISLFGKDITNSDVDSNFLMSVGKAFMLDTSNSGHGEWGATLDL